MAAVVEDARADGAREGLMIKRKVGRPRIGAGKLPPVTVPSDVEKLARDLAEYEGLSLAAYIRRAVVLDTKTRQTRKSVHTEFIATA